MLRTLSFLALFMSLSAVLGQDKKSLMISETDGAVDMSGFLNSTTGFLPVPILITEPAVGIGGGLALAYFHKKKGEGEARPKGLSPTVSFAAGAYTSNGTWLVGGGHQGSYRNDRIRYLGVLAYTSANLTFYGGDYGILKGEYEFNIKGFLTMQELLYRVNQETPLFIGLNYIYFNNTIGFETGLEIPELEKLEVENNTAGLSGVFLYDKRNNSLSPTKGIYTALELGAHNEFLGGDNNYGKAESRSYFYSPFAGDKVFSGYRLHLISKWGDVPFYERPFISLRGIQALRYQGYNVYTLETEWRWNFIKRWSLVGFIGAGEALPDYGDIFDDVKVAGGTGIRYFLAEQYGLHAGVDIARGPEIWTWNITIGSHWGR
jgi:hypothetical protein